MAAEQLQIQVQANVQQAISSLNNFNTQLNVTGNAVENLGTKSIEVLNNQLQRLQRLAQNPNLSTEQYQRLGKLINDTSKEADRLSKSLLILNRSNTQLSSGTAQASTAITNFSRVASDAPFGLIGIANNIDPLIQSFVQLRKETGSGKAALQALTTSLAGGGGLILGVSLLTSALQFAQIGLSRWGASTKQAKEEQDELTSTFASQYTEVLLLTKAYQNSENTITQRRNILSQLNEISDKYFGNLSAEKSTIEDLQKSYDAYIDNLIRALTVKQLEADLQPLVKQLAAAQATIVKLGKNAQITGLQLVNVRGLTGQALENARAQNLRASNELRNLTSAQRAALSTSGIFEYNAAIGQSADLWKEINDLINGQTISIAASNKKQNDGNNGIAKAIDLLKEYNISLKAISWNEINRGIDGTIERLNLAESTLQSFLKQGIEPTRKEFVFITQEVEKFRAAYARVLASGRIELSIPKIEDKEVNKFAQSLQKLDTFKDAPGFVLESLSKGLIKANEGAAKLGETFKAADILRKNSEKNLKELTATIEGFVNPVIDNLFSALEQGEDPFKALIQSVKQLVFELGKAVVKSLILKAIQSAIAPQTAGLPGGIGTAGFLPGVRFDQLRFAFIR